MRSRDFLGLESRSESLLHDIDGLRLVSMEVV